MIRTLAVIFLLIFLIPGCGKDSRPLIPYAYVNLQLYPNTMDFIPIGGTIYRPEGYRGIIIYRMLPDQFAVYERCCPFDPEKAGAMVTVDVSSSTCTDTVCMSKFILYDGTPYAGPSPYALMQYRWNYDGEVLYIYN